MTEHKSYLLKVRDFAVLYFNKNVCWKNLWERRTNLDSNIDITPIAVNGCTDFVAFSVHIYRFLHIFVIEYSTYI